MKMSQRIVRGQDADFPGIKDAEGFGWAMRFNMKPVARIEGKLTVAFGKVENGGKLFVMQNANTTKGY